MCGLPWLHIDVDEGRLSWLACFTLLSSTDICWRGVEGGGGGSVQGINVSVVCQHWDTLLHIIYD